VNLIWMIHKSLRDFRNQFLHESPQHEKEPA
jgi:hypothetical protein